jgi:hypothetical protein
VTRAALNLSDIPVDLGRDQARRLAEQELADPAYRGLQPNLIERSIQWILGHIQALSEQIGQTAPGGWLGILGLLGLLAIALLLVRWRIGPITTSAPLRITVSLATSAADYSARADQAAMRGDWGQAISDRMRAIVRAGQERGLIDPQPGWTADEVAARLGNALPNAELTLRRAALTFDEVRYGGRAATAQAHEVLAVASERVRAERVTLR